MALSKVTLVVAAGTALPVGTALEYFVNTDGSLSPIGGIADPLNPDNYLKPDSAGAIAIIGDGYRTVTTTVTLAADVTGYSVGDAVGPLFTLATASRKPGQTIILTHLAISTPNKAWSPTLRVHFFNTVSPASAAADNAPFGMISPDDTGPYQRYVDFGPMGTEDATLSTMAAVFDAFSLAMVTNGTNGNLTGQIQAKSPISSKVASQTLTVTATFKEKG